MSKEKQKPQQSSEQDDTDAVSLFNQLATKSDSKGDESDSSEDSQDSAEPENDGLDREGDDDSDEDSEDNSSEDDSEEDEGEDNGVDDDDTDDKNSSSEKDPWAKAPETLRNQHQDLQKRHDLLEHQRRSDSGRVSALTRELTSLRKQLAEIEKKSGSSNDSDTPSSKDLEGKTFEQVREEWPELAKYVEAQVQKAQAHVNEKLTPVEQWRQQYEHDQQQQATQAEYEKLAQAHPDFAEVAQDKAFAEWIQTQPPGIQAMYGSNSADDNILLLNLYKGNQQSAQKPSGTPPQKPKKKLSEHAEVPKKGPSRAPANLDDVDPVELFTRLAK